MNFKKLFLSTALFCATSTYAIAQNANIPRDTIWAYGYPVLEKPSIVINRNYELQTFSSTGYYYTYSNSSDTSMLSISKHERASIQPGYQDFWMTSIRETRQRIGNRAKNMTNIDIMMLIIRVIAYNCLDAEHKNPKNFSLNRGFDINSKDIYEREFMRQFAEYLRQNGLRISDKDGKLYRAPRTQNTGR